jgi:transcriptional regulator with XRE-family HTH domain
VKASHRTGKQKAVLFPDQRRTLETLGYNLHLARKRRGLSQEALSERAGVNRKTLRNIEKGDPGVAIGHYLRVLGALSLDQDLTKVGLDDELGRKLQDIETLGNRK